ncbi:MAG: App1 family protein, partial [Ginsengibacter sp.]
SDIDDTFLISHTSSLRKRLYVLFTRNARTRRPFEGVVEHYQLLNKGSRAFFYVSSSEWNLYDYIAEFIHVQALPEGCLLLNQIKTFSKLFATGQGKHNGKFTRIVRLLEAYPDQKFVLLGDDSQKDPEIYASLVQHFPNRIFCVYIRRLAIKEKALVLQKKEFIEAAGVGFCYFYHSADAIQHSQKTGLIK